MVQRRQIPRPRRLPVRIRVDAQTQKMFFQSEIMNLSKGGLFIVSDITLPTGSFVEFEFTLPKSQRTLEVSGIVVWSRSRLDQKEAISFKGHPAGMGVQFKELSTSQTEAILEEIDLHKKKI